MFEQGLFEDDFATDVNHIASLVAQEALFVDEAALAINAVALVVLREDRLTARVHLNVAEHSVDIEAREGEDLGELAILELGAKEEDLAFTRANVTVASNDVALLVDHKARLVHVHVLSSLILTQEKLDVATLIPIKDSHDFLQLERLAIVVVQLGHEATELAELLVIESLATVLVDDAVLGVDQEAL